MKCDLCERESNVEIVYNENGKWITRHLCNTCFSKEMGRLMSGIHELFTSGFRKTAGSKPEKSCPHCGTTMEHLTLHGAGCLGCYKSFEKELTHAYRTSNGSSEYLGKAPLFYEGVRQLYILIKEKESEIKIHVNQDEYEDAARLRDEIQNLKTRLKQMRAGSNAELD